MQDEIYMDCTAVRGLCKRYRAWFSQNCMGLEPQAWTSLSEDTLGRRYFSNMLGYCDSNHFPPATCTRALVSISSLFVGVACTPGWYFASLLNRNRFESLLMLSDTINRSKGAGHSTSAVHRQSKQVPAGWSSFNHLHSRVARHWVW